MVLYYAKIVAEMVLNPLAAVVGGLFLIELVKFSDKMQNDQKWFARLVLVLMIVFISALPIPLWGKLIMACVPFVLNLLDIKHLPKDRGYVRINIAETFAALSLMGVCGFLLILLKLT